jgi:hypothetical protein
MKLLLESTGREIKIKARKGPGRAKGTLWQGETSNGVPVMVVLVVCTPLIAADDPRQAEFEDDLMVELDPTALHPEVELFPLELVL